MRKIVLVLILLALSACGVEPSQQLKGEYRIEYQTEIANTKKFRATLNSLENKHDEVLGEYKEITFTVENRSNVPIEVQAHNIYGDGKRLNQGSGIMSEEIKPGKKVKCTLTLQSYTNSKLPLIEEKIEFDLHIFSWAHDDISEDFPVEIEL